MAAGAAMGLAGGHVAQPHRGVCAGGGQQLSVGAERHAEHRVGVALRPSARLSIHAVDKLVGLRLAGAVHAVKPAMSGHRRPVARRPVLRKAVRRYGHNDAPPRTSKASRERGHGRRGSQASHGLKRPGVLSSTATSSRDAEGRLVPPKRDEAPFRGAVLVRRWSARWTGRRPTACSPRHRCRRWHAGTTRPAA
jgi:hypothetical protein